ncbi:MAG: hypothetical protein HC923_00440, partial [Myxococcales bacterium]|nr:hypothetical protein [Myxococcales bacterium]
LLGRPFALTGRVVPGDGRGRTIGFPTANLEAEVELIPQSGVYASRLVLLGEDPVHRLDAVTNIGVRPTFDGTNMSIETHVLDSDVDLYGQRVDVELVKRIRPERKFASVDELVAQIAQDILQAREALAA